MRECEQGPRTDPVTADRHRGREETARGTVSAGRVGWGRVG